MVICWHKPFEFTVNGFVDKLDPDFQIFKIFFLLDQKYLL